jgi:hypothetical protein
MGTITEESAPRPEEQLDAIRSMLSAGHHSITLELHSFLLWGFGAAIALQVWPRVFAPERFPEPLILASIQTVTAGLLFGGTAWLDVHLSIRAKRRRDETYSWTQWQLGKLTLLFAALALVLGFGSHFNPWSGAIHIFFLGLMGVTLVAHGLFSDNLLVWAGCATLALAAAEVVLRFPKVATHWVATAAYGLGVTSLGPLYKWARQRSLLVRLACVVVWIAVVAAAGIACYEATRPIEAPTVLRFP